MLQGNTLRLSDLTCLNSSQIRLPTLGLELYIYISAIIDYHTCQLLTPCSKAVNVSFTFTNIHLPLAVHCKPHEPASSSRILKTQSVSRMNILTTMYLSCLYLHQLRVNDNRTIQHRIQVLKYV